ncbi:unnamed protein product [Rhizophagus irregularis]|nr:unnamed protein product [Rhizophagus irregularis]CAB5189548.1 unnamed protein product [Rhizophagus irregularis]
MYIYTTLFSIKSDYLKAILISMSYIIKIFFVTTLLSTSTIVTNSLLAIFAIPSFYSCYLFNELFKSHSYSRKLDKLVNELSNSVGKPMIDSASDNEDNKDNKGKYFSLFNTIINARKFNIEILVSTFTEKGRNRAIERTQKVIRCYYLFGKELKSHFDKLKELGNKDRTAQALVNEEVRKQLSYKYVERTISIAQKVYEFFNEIGEDKMQIKSFSAEEISELSCDDIDFIFAKLANLQKEKNQEDQEGINQEEKDQVIYIE